MPLELGTDEVPSSTAAGDADASAVRQIVRRLTPGRDRLLPEYESPGSSPSEGWEPGKGAVGAAFASASLVRVHGPAVWDGTYGLTPAQQEKNRGLAVVVAMPLLNARILAVGVLAVSTTVEDPFIVSDPAAEMIRELAEVVARVLIDVFRVSRD